MIIAEIGVDMSIFPTAKQLASWADQCPGNDQSAGKRRSGKTRKGSKEWLDWALEEAAMSAIRTKDSYLGAQYARLTAPPRPQESARRRQALDHLHLLTHAQHRRGLQRPRRRLLPQTRDPERITKRLIAQLEALGHVVTLQPTATATSTAPAVVAA